MKALDEYFLMVVFTLLLNRVHVFAIFCLGKHGSERVRYYLLATFSFCELSDITEKHSFKQSLNFNFAKLTTLSAKLPQSLSNTLNLSPQEKFNFKSSKSTFLYYCQCRQGSQVGAVVIILASHHCRNSKFIDKEARGRS